MNRRAFVTGLGATLAAPARAEAQQTAKVYRVGFITPLALGSAEEQAFWRGLHDLGYVRGHNLIGESRRAEDPERFATLAAELVAAKIDVIVTATGTAALAAKSVTSTVPIVMTASADAVAQGIVHSLRRPGGNVTGLTSLSPELGAKRLEILKQALPHIKRASALWCSDMPYNREEARHVATAAQALGITIESVECGSRQAWNAAVEACKTKRPEALLASDCPTMPLASIREFSLQERLPMMAPYASSARRGVLLTYGPDFAAMHRTAAKLVDKIIKGANPAELPIEQPTKFELVINLKTAKALGLTIPPSLLVRADQVIE